MGPLICESRALCLLNFSEQTPYQLFNTQGSGVLDPCTVQELLAGQHSVQGMNAVDFICCELQMGLRRLFQLYS